MEYKIVLIAKGSDIGEKAAELAAKMALEKKIDSIHVLFISDIDFFKSSGYVNTEKELKTALKNIGNVIMEKLEDTIKSINNAVKVEKIELAGKTAEEILKFVQENRVDTIIIPKEKRGPIEKSIVGGDIEPFFDQIKKYVSNCVVVS